MVEVAVSRSAAQQRTLQAEFAHRPLKLPRRGLRIRGRQGGEALEPVRMPRARLGDEVVHEPGRLDGRSGLQVVQPRRGE